VSVVLTIPRNKFGGITESIGYVRLRFSRDSIFDDLLTQVQPFDRMHRTRQTGKGPCTHDGLYEVGSVKTAAKPTRTHRVRAQPPGRRCFQYLLCEGVRSVLSILYILCECVSSDT